MLRLIIALGLLCGLTGAKSFAEENDLVGHGGPVKGIAVTEDVILTSSFDNSVGVWSLPDRNPIWLEGHSAAVNAAKILSDGRFASVGDDMQLRIWNSDGTELNVLSGHKGKIISLAVKENLVATAGWDGVVGVWNSETGEQIMWIDSHEGQVNDVSFSTDGSRLFSASNDGTIREWDRKTGEELRVLARHGFGINVLSMAHNGSWLLYGALDGGTRAIDLESGEVLADLSADRRPILALSVSNDDALVAVGDGEGYIMVIDTQDWTVRYDFRAAANGPIWALAFDESGDGIYAGGISDVAHYFPLDAVDRPLMASNQRSFLRDPSEMSNGERQFMRKCSICHELRGSAGRKAGPTLNGLFGRLAGSVSGYHYSDALKKSEITWDETTIDGLFDKGPEHYIPGTKMPMQRIVNARDRHDLVNYLRTYTGDPSE
ncbi:c-type cytochrome [Algicella marina]|uniref:C-type cytochrome n=1 Tax=Algicella marina TaxID=2683284 RepID=A0A6P1T1E5_9RHOB|nr:c-type cytochrome [Algicella marina]QHQ35276.1 c-type cytochrome [Algicella marina]